MTNSVFINALSTSLLALTSFIYLLLVGNYVPDKHALTINFMLVPFLFGCAGYFLLKGALTTKLLLLAVLPMVHVIYFGVDNTKPGLEDVIALGEYVFVSVGVLLCFIVNRFIRLKAISKHKVLLRRTPLK